LSALRIIFQPCTPLQPFFSKGCARAPGEPPSSGCTPVFREEEKFIDNYGKYSLSMLIISAVLFEYKKSVSDRSHQRNILALS
jgi:hypothetical protein